MLETILPKIVKPEKVNWREPDYMDMQIGDNDIRYHLLKGALDVLSKELGFKTSTSKDVFKIDKDVWSQLKNVVIDKAADPNNQSKYKFDLVSDNIIYLTNEYHDIIDIFKLNSITLKDFQDIIDKFILDITTMEKYNKFCTDGKGGLFKLVIYSNKINPAEVDYTPVVIMEFNHEKSVYKVYNGILIYEPFTFIPSISKYIDSNSFGDFIYRLDLEGILKYATDTAEDLYNAYKSFKESATEISARELISVLKKSGYKLELTMDDQLGEIDNMNDKDSSSKIQKFFNTFTFSTGESAYDILALPELKKIFRYNKLTILDVLNVLSKEYLTWDGSKINADILSAIIYNLYDKQNDKRQVELLKSEVK